MIVEENLNFNWPLKFEIPHSWFLEAGVINLKFPKSVSYRSSLDAPLVRASSIMPCRRNEGVRWFDSDRMISILKGFKADAEVPPIEVVNLEEPNNYQFALYDGFHRFYASIAFGFEYLPVNIRSEEKLDMLLG